MNFFRLCIYICLSLIAFTLVINFIDSTSAFDTKVDSGIQVTDEQGSMNIISVFTNTEDDTMNSVWLLAVGSTLVGAVGLAFLTRSIVPVGIHLFSTIFWTSYIRAMSVIYAGGFVDNVSGLILVFTVVILFIFIAAIVGILTGGG